MSIHRPFYCSVHVDIVVHICNSVWYFWWRRICVYYFCFICLDLGIKFIIPLTGLIQPHFVCRIYARTWISISICPGIFGVQWFDIVARFVGISGIVDYHCLNFISTVIVIRSSFLVDKIMPMLAVSSARCIYILTRWPCSLNTVFRHWYDLLDIFLNNVINIKTKVLPPPAYVTLADVGSHV
jgi:hypothetical protein